MKTKQILKSVSKNFNRDTVLLGIKETHTADPFFMDLNRSNMKINHAFYLK